jgi:hypothetical protein
MSTVYIRRTTEDLNEDMEVICEEIDLFLDGTDGRLTSGLGEFADMLDSAASETTELAFDK